MKQLFLIISAAILTTGCAREEIAKGTPACVKAKIKEIAAAEVWNPPAVIYRYQYQQKTVYYIPSRCCDIPSSLIDDNCKILCSPDGGMTGNGDWKCPDFFSTRTNEELVWKDDRKK